MNQGSIVQTEVDPSRRNTQTHHGTVPQEVKKSYYSLFAKTSSRATDKILRVFLTTNDRSVQSLFTILSLSVLLVSLLVECSQMKSLAIGNLGNVDLIFQSLGNSELCRKAAGVV